MKLQHFPCFLSGQYQVMMREKGRVVETVEALSKPGTNAPEQVVMSLWPLESCVWSESELSVY